MTKHSVISILIIVIVFIVLIGGTYGFVIPAFWPDYKTPTILIVGVAIAALCGGYICYQIPLDDTLFVKMSFGLLGAVIVAVLVFFLSLAVIIKIRGS
ncbi:MAG TPA: hypothetical protein PLI90_10000 [Rhodocyclaceae bacterium]|nr:hypothetical protein [Rhodocyclaceae bacterium]